MLRIFSLWIEHIHTHNIIVLKLVDGSASVDDSPSDCVGLDFAFMNFASILDSCSEDSLITSSITVILQVISRKNN